ncbi:MAG TPA: hypothetical protein VGM62_19830 [Chthoniobacterales bacterium]|jgi:hypothetical protein
MKTRKFGFNVVSALAIVISALAITSLVAKEKPAGTDSVFATDMKDGGRLVIKRSPSLGNRLVVALKIDGASASIGYGHTYRVYLLPGRHKLSVMATPKAQNTQAWEMSLDVQAGQTYTFTAQSGGNRQLVLAKG